MRQVQLKATRQSSNRELVEVFEQLKEGTSAVLEPCVSEPLSGVS